MTISGEPPRSATLRIERALADRLFVALDQRNVGDFDDWIVEVLAIHMASDGDTWLQVAPAHDHGTTVLVRLAPCATPNGVISALHQWLSLPSDARPRICDVTARPNV